MGGKPCWVGLVWLLAFMPASKCGDNPGDCGAATELGAPAIGKRCDNVGYLACDGCGSDRGFYCSPSAWEPFACPACDHITGVKTALQCNGLEVANENLACDVPGAAACANGTPTHNLTCDGATHTWKLFQDCGAKSMICGHVNATTLGCVPPSASSGSASAGSGGSTGSGGGCTPACTGGQTCQGGVCKCPFADDVFCFNHCTKPATDNFYCGCMPNTAGITCGANQQCCGGKCRTCSNPDPVTCVCK